MSAASGIKGLDPDVGKYYQMIPEEGQGGGQSQSLGSLAGPALPAGMDPAVVAAAAQLLAAQGGLRAPNISYPDGSYYIGPMQNRAPHGVGTMHYFAIDQRGRLKYEGGFVNGVRQGRGLLTWRNGSTYLGEFNNDQATGEGIKKYYGDNHEVIQLEEGTFQDNVLVQGRRAKTRGREEEGTFQNGVLAQGRRVETGGLEEVGTFNNGELWNGRRQDNPYRASQEYRDGQRVVPECCVIL